MRRITCFILSAVILMSVFVFGVNAADTPDCKLAAGETMEIGASGTEIVSAKSSDTKIAKVKNNTITALTKGNAVVTVNLSNGEAVNYNVEVTSNPKIVGKKTKAEKDYTFTIDVAGAATKITYSSSKPKIASITKLGHITTHKIGTTKITAKVNGVKLSFNLKVYEKEVVNKYKETFKKGYTYSLYYSSVGKNPKIVSDNPKIIKVTKNGKLKAKKRGTATVTFSYKKAKAIVKVKVV